MKKIWCLALLAFVLLVIGTCAAKVPDLAGNWTGTCGGYVDGIGYTTSIENESMTLSVAEQEDRIFVGKLTINRENEAYISEEFAGAIGLDNKTLHLAEFGKGYALGTMVSSDEIELIYLSDGENGSIAIDRLNRIKEHRISLADKNITEKNRVTTFIDEAATYVEHNGVEKALQEFNNSSGSFVRGELYIFAYDFNGTNIAHPIRPDLVGHDQRGLLDINGVAVAKNELDLAKRGGGILYLVFQNPAHNNNEELKLTYIKKLNENLWIGSGTYLSNVSASFSKEEIAYLVSYVDEALQFAKENGKEKSLAVFNDPEGSFAKDGRYIFAYDYEGRTLALPNQPELIGTNRIDVHDPNGVDFVHQAIDAARPENGFLYYIYPDPSKNMTQKLKLSYAVNVDDKWFLGSGIYAKGED